MLLNSQLFCFTGFISDQERIREYKFYTFKFSKLVFLEDDQAVVDTVCRYLLRMFSLSGANARHSGLSG